MPSRLTQLKEREKRTTTPSDLLADLHVYILPVNKWIPFRRLARNHVIEETVSAGFVRVSPTSTLLELRSILSQQLDLDFPQFYVYIRSVGRNFTQVKKHQESILKVKHFLPPQATEPEIHILEISEDLIKKSGSVPNLLLSESDFSDHALSALTGRLSYVGSEADVSRKNSHLLTSQGLHQDSSGYGSTRFDPERILSSSNRIIDPERISTQERNGRIGPRNRTDATSDDEDSLTGDSYDENINKKSQSRLRASPPKRKKAVSESRLNRGTLSSEEEVKEPKVVRSKSEAIGAPLSSEAIGAPPSAEAIGFPPSSNDMSYSNIRRATSLNVLQGHPHDTGTEDEDKLGLGYKDRSRQRIKTNRRGHSRSISVSAIEGNRPLTRDNELNKSYPMEKMRSKSQGDHQGYAPHKWRLQREAKILEKEVKIRTRLMEELEAMREAQKAEEARKFEEELREEEAIEEANMQGRRESQSRTEILNLEGTVPIEMIEDEDTQYLKGEYTLSPDGVVENNPIIGRLIGEQSEGFEITYELKFSDNDIDEYDEIGTIVVSGRSENKIRGTSIEESVEVVVNGKNNFNRKNENLEGKVKKKIIKTKKHKNLENDLSKNPNDLSKNPIKEEKKIRKLQIENKTDLEKEEEMKKRKDNSKQNEDKEENKYKEKLSTTGAWADGEQNSQLTFLQNGELETQRPQNNIENIQNEGIVGNKKIRSSYHRKKRITNSTHKKDRTVPREALEVVRKERETLEDNRTQLFNHARNLHEKILTIRERKRQKWWDEYNAARRKGTRLEERQANLRQELETLYRRVLGSLMKRQPLVTGVRDEPSRKASYKISVIRLRHEISDLLRRVEAIDIKLQAELRLRQQAEREVKQLRSEVSRKKANVALSQSRAPLLRNIANIPDDILIRL